MIINFWTQVYAFFYIPIIFSGVFGNIVSFHIYFKQHKKSTISLLLCALSICDLLLLLLALPVSCISMLPIGDLNDTHSTHYMLFTYSLKYCYPVLMMAKTASWYILVAITMERWIAVCRPLHLKAWCTYRNTIVIITVIFTFSILFHFVKFWENNLWPDDDGYDYLKRSDLFKKTWFFLMYDISLSTIFEYMIPFFMMSIFNYQVTQELRASHQKRQMLTTSQLREQKTTLMLLVVTILFAICHLFAIAVKVCEFVFGQRKEEVIVQADGTIFTKPPPQNQFFENIVELSNMIIIAHSSATFFIYFIFSSRFRSNCYKVFEKSRKKVSDTDDTAVGAAAKAATRTLTLTLNELTTLMESRIVEA